MAAAEGLTDQFCVLAGAVFAPAVLGAGVVTAVAGPLRLGRRELAAFAYLTGQLLLAPFTFAWLAAGKPVPGALLPLVAFAVGTGLLLWQRRRHGGLSERSGTDPVAAIVAAIGVAAIVLLCLRANLTPIVGGDEALIWSSKARVLFAAPDFGIGLGLAYHVGHPAYPLLNPLVQALAFVSAGDLLSFASRIPIQAFAAALVLLLSTMLGVAGRVAGAALLLATVTVGSFVTESPTACADVMLAFAMLAACHAYLRYRTTGAAGWWRLCCVALAATVATKNEGAMLVLVLVLAHLLAALMTRLRGGDRDDSRLPLRNLPWLVVPIATLALGQWFNHRHGLTTDLVDPALGQGMGLLERCLHFLPERAVPVASFYLDALLAVDSRWLVLLALPAAAVLVLFRPRPALVLAIALPGWLLAYMLVFVGTSNPLPWHLATAAHRTILHVTPVAAVVLAHAIAALGNPYPVRTATPATGLAV